MAFVKKFIKNWFLHKDDDKLTKKTHNKQMIYKPSNNVIFSALFHNNKLATNRKNDDMTILGPYNLFPLNGISSKRKRKHQSLQRILGVILTNISWVSIRWDWKVIILITLKSIYDSFVENSLLNFSRIQSNLK